MKTPRHHCLAIDHEDGDSAICRKSPGHHKSISPAKRGHYDPSSDRRWWTPGPVATVEFLSEALVRVSFPRARKEFITEIETLGGVAEADRQYMVIRDRLDRLATLFGTMYPTWTVAQQCRKCGVIRSDVDVTGGAWYCGTCAS